MLKQVFLAHFEPVLTKFSPFHHMYAQRCALRTYLRAVWWSDLELGEGCRLEDIYTYIYIYIHVYTLSECLFFFDVLQIFVMDPPRRPGAAGGTVKPWPGGSRGLPGPRPPRHLEWLPAAAAPAGAVAAAGGRSVVPTSQTAPTIEARCVPATCLRRACDLPTQCPA